MKLSFLTVSGAILLLFAGGVWGETSEDVYLSCEVKEGRDQERFILLVNLEREYWKRPVWDKANQWKRPEWKGDKFGPKERLDWSEAYPMMISEFILDLALPERDPEKDPFAFIERTSLIYEQYGQNTVIRGGETGNVKVYPQNFQCSKIDKEETEEYIKARNLKSKQHWKEIEEFNKKRLEKRKI